MQHIPIDLILIINKINFAGGNAYIVGGAVRNHLMGLPINDFDVVVVNMTRDDMDKMFPDAIWVGKDFPVMLIDGYEVALARKERKIGVGHAGFACDTDGVTLEDDLRRRDLTVNAIAYDPLKGDFVDPFYGMEDIRDELLTPVSKAFAEDPLRVFRAARFVSQLDMWPNQTLLDACTNMLDEIRHLPAERVFNEMMKALRTDRPPRFFAFLDEVGALDVWFPELAALKGREQPDKYHPEGDAFVHTMLVIDRARQLGADDVTMWAALVHDLGKAVTDSDAPSFHHYNHEALGVPLVEQLCKRLKVPEDYMRIGKKTAKEHLNIHRFNDLRAIKRVDLLMRLGDDFEAVTLASQADAQGRGPTLVDRPYPQREAVREAHRVFWTVRGSSEMGAGPQVGEKLRQLRAQALRANGMGR